MQRTPRLPQHATRGLFFFSSRRRHTRFDCDWSSDVCSSDLGFPNFGEVDDVANFEQIQRGLQCLEDEWVYRSEEHTSELQSQSNLVCRLLLEKKKTSKKFSSIIWTNRPCTG